MRHTMSITAFAATLLVSAAAYAVDNNASGTIGSLPDKGHVQLSGSVDRVVDGDTFVLRDSTGDTIDVHSKSQLTVKKGDRVSVQGEKTAEVAGMGEEIRNASVSISGDMAKNNMSNKNAPADKMANRQGNAASRDMASGATAAASANTATAAANANDTIEALPKEGAVELNGVVERVSNDTQFILRDADGKTIDIHTASAVKVQPGDTVSVNGNVKSELFGFGRQIEGAKVLVVSSADNN